MEYREQYFMYKDLVESGYQIIKTKDSTSSSIDQYFYGLINIAKDYIETEEIRRLMIKFIFEDKEDVELSLFDSVFNIMMWYMPVGVGAKITSVLLFFPENITRKEIKKYIDNTFVDKYRKIVPFILLNL